MRCDDWPMVLHAYVERHRAVPFEWGKHDCVRFAAGWVKELTGIDYVSDLSWSDKRSAYLLLRDQSLEGRLDVLFDRHASITFTRRGDLVLTTNDEGEDCLAVCIGATVVAPRVTGLEFLPLFGAALASWRVE